MPRVVERERATRLAPWEGEVGPLLDDIAAGRRSARDPAVGDRCRQLATALRSKLATETESILCALLTPPDGIALVIRDLDLGHRLAEADRIELVSLVRTICAGRTAGTLYINLLPDTQPGAALAVLAGDGLHWPGPHRDGFLITEGPTRWWYDFPLRCDPQPLIATESTRTTTVRVRPESASP